MSTNTITQLGKLTFHKRYSISTYSGDTYWHWNILLNGKSIKGAYITTERMDFFSNNPRYVYIPHYNKTEIVERGIPSLYAAKIYLVDYVNKHHHIQKKQNSPRKNY